MDRAGAISLKSIEVLRGRVSLVPVKSVFRKLVVKVLHQPVACDLGQDRGGGNGRDPMVALHNGMYLGVQFRRPIAIDQCQGGFGIERPDGSLHAFKRCPEDIDSIDFLHLDNFNSPAVSTCPDFVEQPLPGGRAQSLGIVQPCQPMILGQDDG